MADVRDFLAEVDAKFKDSSYLEICEEIRAKLMGFVIGVVPIAPLAEIVLEYAGLDSYGLFMLISAIHLKGVSVMPIGTKYYICVAASHRCTQFTVCEHYKIYTTDVDGTQHVTHSESCFRAERKYIFDSHEVYNFVIRNDTVAIGNILAVAMNKPWWETKEKKCVGTTCILNLTMKAKLMLWRLMRRAGDLCDVGSRTIFPDGRERCVYRCC